jgi:hypothetical protein
MLLGLIVRSLGTSTLASGCGFESKLGLRTTWRTATALRGVLLYIRTGLASEEMNA